MKQVPSYKLRDTEAGSGTTGGGHMIVYDQFHNGDSSTTELPSRNSSVKEEKGLSLWY